MLSKREREREMESNQTRSFNLLLEHCITATQQLIQASAGLNKEEQDAPPSLPSTVGQCPAEAVQLLYRQAVAMARLHHANPHNHKDTAHALATKRLDDLAHLAYRRFYHGDYASVPESWRELYTAAHALKFHGMVLQWRDQPATSPDDVRLDAMVAVLDYALIVAGAPGRIVGAAWTARALALLESSLPVSTATTTTTNLTINDAIADPHIQATRPLPRRRSPGLAAFEAALAAAPPQPAVFTDLAAAWPALAARPWRDPAYLLARTFAGRRLVPIELGRSYVDDGWGQALVRFRDFLGVHIAEAAASPRALPTGVPTGIPTGYLAQHNLLRQIPALAADVGTPELCWADTPAGAARTDVPLCNAWFGPARTITPLHTDGFHNVLSQVVGHKYVRLYAPGETGRMRRRGRGADGVDWGNTSGIDVGVLEGWDRGEGGDEEGQEQARRIPYVDCVLGPGDSLYIPRGWWHYCRSLSVSFSVSYWWN